MFKLKKLMAMALLFCLMASNVGCSILKENKSDNADKTSAIKKVNKHKKKVNKHKKKVESANSIAYKEYKKILDSMDQSKYFEGINVEDIFFGDKVELSKKDFKYDLIKMDNQKIPALAVYVSLDINGGGYDYIRVYEYNEKEKKVFVSDRLLLGGGVSRAGGYRGGCSESKTHSGIFCAEWSSGTGEGSITKYTLDHSKFIKETIFEGQIFGGVDSNIKTPGNKVSDDYQLEKIDFVPISDTSKLDKAFKGIYKDKIERNSKKNNKKHAKKKHNSKKERKSKKKLNALIKEERAKGNIVLKGTLKCLKGTEVLALQHEKDPNPGTGDDQKMYLVFILKTPQNLKCIHVDRSYHEHSAMMIKVGDDMNIPKYLNKKLIMSFRSDRIIFPSDTGLPLGQPYSNEYKVLKVLD